jgi:cell division transport system permease protein
MIRPAYFVRKASEAMARAPFVTLVATGTIFAAAFVTGLFAACLGGVEQVVNRWGGEVQISVYLAPGADLSAAQAAVRGLAPGHPVEAVGSAAALARLRASLGKEAAALDGVRDDILPASIEVRVRGLAPAEAHALAARLRSVPGATDVDDGGAWLERLEIFLRRLRIGGVALLAALCLATAVLIGNTLGLAIYARRDEIEIMQLVGATDRFVAAPFLIEGLLEGLAGAGLAALALLGGWAALGPVLRGHVELAAQLGRSDVLPDRLLAILVAGGGGLGLVASLFSVARFLRRAPG